MATITGSFSQNNKNIGIYVEYTYTQNVANNTSTVSVKLYGKRKTSYGNSYKSNTNCEIKIGGTSVYSKTQAVDFRKVSTGSSILIGSGSRTVTHNSDGTLSLEIYGKIDLSGTSPGVGTVKSKVSLKTIPRKTNISVSGTKKFGETITIGHAGASSSFKHNIKYMIGSLSGKIASDTTATSTKWVIPKNLQEQIPNSTSGSIKLILETLSGSSVIGTSESMITVNISDDCIPSISNVDFSDAMNKPEGIDGYYQGYSKLKSNITAMGVYGSTIKKYRVTVGGEIDVSSTTNIITTGALTSNGVFNVTVHVTDSRGKSITKTYSNYLTVTPYSKPEILTFTYDRTEISDGIETPSNMGNIGYISFSRKFWDTSTNRKVVFKYKPKSSDVWTSITLNDMDYDKYKFSSTLSTADAYILRLELSDMLSIVNKDIEMTNIFPLISLNPKGDGLAFGKDSTLSNIMEIDLKTYLNKDLELKNNSKLFIHGKNSDGEDGYIRFGINEQNNDCWMHNSFSGKYIVMMHDGWFKYTGSARLGNGGETVRIYGGSSADNNTAYITFFPNVKAHGTDRYGWFGYGSPGSNVMSMTNIKGDIDINPTNGIAKAKGSEILTKSNTSPKKLWSGSLSGTNSITLKGAKMYNYIGIYGKPGGASAHVGNLFVKPMYDTTSTSNYLQITTEVGYIKFAMYVSGNDVIIKGNAGSGSIQYIYGGF